VGSEQKNFPPAVSPDEWSKNFGERPRYRVQGEDFLRGQRTVTLTSPERCSQL